MTSRYLIFTALIAAFSANAQNKYSYFTDLKNVHNDQVAIELKVPSLSEKTVIYSFPAAIPGSYARKDYGRFVSHFNAFNKAGKKLKAEKLNDNQYKIDNADELSTIKYKVADTWDKSHDNFIFQPGGTNIEAGKNFVINNHAFYGYFEEYKDLPIEVTVAKPDNLFGATHLSIQQKAGDMDIIEAGSYKELADNPVLYAEADTTSFYSGKTKINVAVYSANKKVSSTRIAEIIKPMVQAMSVFFNGLPVDSYQFLYYFEDQEKAISTSKDGLAGFGALEHNYCSLYYLPESPFPDQLKSMVLEASTHEFLHILAPLNLHSEEIANFDFSEPEMSQHLWLYEGVTEYFAQLALLQSKLIDQNKFITNLQEKIYQAADYGDFSMTEMSKKVMENEFQQKYQSVYNRGALLAMMLDLEIREKTAGQKTLKSVVQTLALKHGPNKPFKDMEFFNEFVSESHPDIDKFINVYIKGTSKLPLNEYFGKIGFNCFPTKKIEGYYAGALGKRIDQNTNSIIFSNVKSNVLGIKNDDVLIKIQDFDVTLNNIEVLWEKYFDYNLNAPELYVTVKRQGVEQQLSAKLYRGRMDVKNYLEAVKAPTALQSKLLQDLLH